MSKHSWGGWQTPVAADREYIRGRFYRHDTSTTIAAHMDRMAHRLVRSLLPKRLIVENELAGRGETVCITYKTAHRELVWVDVFRLSPGAVRYSPEMLTLEWLDHTRVLRTEVRSGRREHITSFVFPRAFMLGLTKYAAPLLNNTRHALHNGDTPYQSLTRALDGFHNQHIREIVYAARDFGAYESKSSNREKYAKKYVTSACAQACLSERLEDQGVFVNGLNIKVPKLYTGVVLPRAALEVTK